MCEDHHGQPGSPDWSRSFIADQAHAFLHGATARDARDAQMGPVLLARCTAHLMALCQCSRRTAETVAGQALAEIASRATKARFDMDRSTSYALFFDNVELGTTQMITVAEFQRLVQRQWPATQPAPPNASPCA